MKFTKYVLLCLLVLSVSGCGLFDRTVASVTGGANATCVDGVVYLQFTSGATVAYNQDGTVKTCKG